MIALRGWIGAAHPFPLAMVMALTALVAVASADGSPPTGRLALLLVAMLLSQLAIGWSNDYLDRANDAVYQPAKPVPSGLVDARRMPPAIGLAMAGALMAGILLGAMPLLLLAIGTCCGLAYNLGIKNTRYSALPFVLALAVLPLFVWTALDVYRSELLPLYPIGITLPVAANIANVLPDLEGDRAQGRRTIAVGLGATQSIVLTMACQLAPLFLALLAGFWLSYDWSLLGPSLGAYLLLTAAAGGLYRRYRDRESHVRAFRALTAASVVFAAGWLAAV